MDFPYPHPPGPPRMMLWWCRECVLCSAVQCGAVQCPNRFLMTRSSHPGAQVAAVLYYQS